MAFPKIGLCAGLCDFGNRSLGPLISYQTRTYLSWAKLRDFIVEYAKFPFPLPDELRTIGNTTDISDPEVGSECVWNAKYAVRDDTLVQKPCDSLQDISWTLLVGRY